MGTETQLKIIHSLLGRANTHLPGISAAAAVVSQTHELPATEESIAQQLTILRRNQFAAGRTSARRALRQLGFPKSPIPQDAEGVPIWPTGIVGSIAHKHLISAAVVTRQSTYANLGVDLEKDKPHDEAAIAETILTSSEIEQLHHYHAMGLGSPSTGIFSAKEATYKAAFPRLRRPIEWLDIEVKMDGGNTFMAKILGSTASAWKGLLLTEGGWILALAWPAKDA